MIISNLLVKCLKNWEKVKIYDLVAKFVENMDLFAKIMKNVKMWNLEGLFAKSHEKCENVKVRGFICKI